ncbi:hypothetical protein ACTXT7_006712 [Hymenolepis weldensis]
MDYPRCTSVNDQLRWLIPIISVKIDQFLYKNRNLRKFVAKSLTFALLTYPDRQTRHIRGQGEVNHTQVPASQKAFIVGSGTDNPDITSL